MPPAFEVLLLNTAIPQIQAAQSGDTYVVPRDIAFSAALTLSAGTANGVLYLNGSKVVTSGSALTFDGTANLSFTGTGLYPVIAVYPTGNNAIFGFRMDASAGNGVDWRVEQGRSAVGDFNISAPAVNASPQYVILKNLSAQYWSIGSTETMRLTSTGLKSSIAGTNSDPVFSYTSDTNTGIFFPAADKLGFVAGGGADQMVLTSTGLGIGTSSPVSKLEVRGGTINVGTTNTLTISADGTQRLDFYNYWTGATGVRARIESDGDGISNQYGTLIFYTTQNNNVGVTERARITSGGDFQTSSSGSVMIGGTAARATTAGTNRLDIFDGTAPVGTLANGVSFYSTAGEARVMDAAGNATLLSPHDTETNEWIFHSKHTPTGKVLRIDVERLLKFVNDHFGLDAVQEFIEE